MRQITSKKMLVLVKQKSICDRTPRTSCYGKVGKLHFVLHIKIHAKVVFWRNWDFCRFEMFMLSAKYLRSFNFKKWTEIWKKDCIFSGCQIKIMTSWTLNTFFCFAFQFTRTFDEPYFRLWMSYEGHWCIILILPCSLQICKSKKWPEGKFTGCGVRSHFPLLSVLLMVQTDVSVQTYKFL